MRGAKRAVLLSAVALSACTGGDYGREARGFEGKMERFWAGITDVREPGAPSALALTGSEEELRAAAAQLDEPKRGAERFDPLRTTKLEEALSQRRAPDDPASYYAHMRRTYHQSPEALLHAMDAHIAEDTALAARFAALVRDTAEADRARLESLHETGREGALRRGEMVEAATGVMRRVDENGRAIDRAVEALQNRIEGYRAALMRAGADIPSTEQLARIETSLSALEQSVGALEADAARHAAAMQALFAPAAL